MRCSTGSTSWWCIRTSASRWAEFRSTARTASGLVTARKDRPGLCRRSTTSTRRRFMPNGRGIFRMGRTRLRGWFTTRPRFGFIRAAGRRGRGACIVYPWNVYLFYGDRRVLADAYPSMRRWLAWLEAQSTDGLLRPYGLPKMNIWQFSGRLGFASPRGRHAALQRPLAQRGGESGVQRFAPLSASDAGGSDRRDPWPCRRCTVVPRAGIRHSRGDQPRELRSEDRNLYPGRTAADVPGVSVVVGRRPRGAPAASVAEPGGRYCRASRGGTWISACWAACIRLPPWNEKAGRT